MYLVRLGEAPTTGPIFTYSATKVLRFDYWLPDDGTPLGVQVRNRDKAASYSIRVVSARRGIWARAEVPLGDLKNGTGPPMENGDAIGNLVISGGRVGGTPLYVDNIEIIEQH
jgi:hypothetical protein